MTPDYYSYDEFDHSRTPGVRLVDFGADFISHFEYEMFNIGWRTGNDTIPVEFLERLSRWQRENSDFFVNFLSALEGPTSFMCYLGIDRSGDTATLASMLGIDVVDNSKTIWGQQNGRHFGAAYFSQKMSEGNTFATFDDSGNIYLGESSSSSRNLVIVLDPHHKVESDALDAVMASLRGLEEYLNIWLLPLTETAVKVLAMDYLEVYDSPSSITAQLAQYQSQFEFATV